MAVEVLDIVPHGCAVERINKNHGMIHSKARASLGQTNTKRALFVFTNETLLHNMENSAVATFESFAKVA